MARRQYAIEEGCRGCLGGGLEIKFTLSTWKKEQKCPERMTDRKELGMFSAGKDEGSLQSGKKSPSMKQAVKEREVFRVMPCCSDGSPSVLQALPCPQTKHPHC